MSTFVFVSALRPGARIAGPRVAAALDTLVQQAPRGNRAHRFFRDDTVVSRIEALANAIPFSRRLRSDYRDAIWVVFAQSVRDVFGRISIRDCGPLALEDVAPALSRQPSKLVVISLFGTAKEVKLCGWCGVASRALQYDACSPSCAMYLRAEGRVSRELNQGSVFANDPEWQWLVREFASVYEREDPARLALSTLLLTRLAVVESGAESWRAYYEALRDETDEFDRTGN